MKYSVHNPMRGGFDYYEGPDVTPINDDQPTPVFGASIRTKLGIPASLAGRPLPPDAVLRGHGATAHGAVSSGTRGTWGSTATRSGRNPSGIGLGDFSSPSTLQTVVGLGMIAAAFYFMVKIGKETTRAKKYGYL